MSKHIAARLRVLGIAVLLLGGGEALADTDLANTTWSSDDSTGGCGISITFNGDGTAIVTETQFGQNHTDRAHWTMDGSELSLTYDKWHGGVDGTMVEGGTIIGQNLEAINATETYQDPDTGAERARSCTFVQVQ